MNPQSDQTQFIMQVATAIQRRGLTLPALVALEAGQPLAFISSQLLWVMQPVVSLLLSPTQMASQQYQQLAHLLEEPTAVQSLIHCLGTENK